VAEELKQKVGESDFDYIKRIVYGKLVDKTITAEYEDLSEIVFGDGNCYNSSEVRKRFYGIKRLLDIHEEEKKTLTVEDLMKKFHDDLDDDRILLRED